MIHELKTWPGPFDGVASGAKRHEIRVSDRTYAVDDVLVLKEWNPLRSTYTGREVKARCTYISPGGTWGLPENLCVMSIEVMS